MPAPIPGDPEYDADGGRPIGELEQWRDELRLQRLPMLTELARIEGLRASWDEAALAELDSYGEGPTMLDERDPDVEEDED